MIGLVTYSCGILLLIMTLGGRSVALPLEKRRGFAHGLHHGRVV